MSPSLAPGSAPPQPPRLLDLVRQVARTRWGQDGLGDRCAHWTRRLILCHAKRYPQGGDPGSRPLSLTAGPVRWGSNLAIIDQ
jgi:hypothetical protein